MRALTTFALTLAAAHGATAQSLSRRIAGSDGIVDVVYPSRPGACGDGHSYIQGIIGSGSTYQDDSRGVRKAAIYWLGQTGDPRAVGVYAELLGLR